jgi:hypothetical protein
MQACACVCVCVCVCVRVNVCVTTCVYQAHSLLALPSSTSSFPLWAADRGTSSLVITVSTSVGEGWDGCEQEQEQGSEPGPGERHREQALDRGPLPASLYEKECKLSRVSHGKRCPKSCAHTERDRRLKGNNLNIIRSVGAVTEKVHYNG